MGLPENFKWPHSTWFLLGEGLFERLSAYSLRTLLKPFLIRELALGEKHALSVFHGWFAGSYIFSIISSIATDAYLGRYKSMLAGLVVYTVGQGILTVASIPLTGQHTVISGWVGLAIIAVGSGWIKPSVRAFPGDQFKLPEETKKLSTFFATYYMVANISALLAFFFAPKLRTIQCFGGDCFFGLFTAATVLIFVTTVVFLSGSRFYTYYPPYRNMIAKVPACVTYAVKRKIKLKNVIKKEHWLDYADDKYNAQLIEDIKTVLRLFVLFAPLPLFWTVFEQQGARWTFQATRMRGEIGNLFVIGPEQMQIINPALLLVTLPFFEVVAYPWMDRMNVLNTPLKRMGVGLFLAGLAFTVSGVLELETEKQYAPPLTEYHSMMFFVNDVPCPLDLLISSETRTVHIKLPTDAIASSNLITPQNYTLTLKLDDAAGRLTPEGRLQCEYLMATGGNAFETVIASPAGAGISMIITWEVLYGIRLLRSDKVDLLVKSREGKCIVKIFYKDLMTEVEGIELRGVSTTTFPLPKPGEGVTLEQTIRSDKFNVSLKPSGTWVGNFVAENAGIYLLYVKKDVAKIYTVVGPNTIHMLWQLPQYVLITVAEMFFSASSYTFCYAMAPDSMKTIVQGFWLCAVGMGNFLNVIIGESRVFRLESLTYFLFAILMFFDTLAFIYLAHKFKPSAIIQDTVSEQDEIDQGPIEADQVESEANNISNKYMSASSSSVIDQKQYK